MKGFTVVKLGGAVPAEVTDRRFPPPWTVEEFDECFIVRYANGQAFGSFLL
jgi:hypothetical protein